MPAALPVRFIAHPAPKFPDCLLPRPLGAAPLFAIATGHAPAAPDAQGPALEQKVVVCSKVGLGRLEIPARSTLRAAATAS